MTASGSPLANTSARASLFSMSTTDTGSDAPVISSPLWKASRLLLWKLSTTRRYEPRLDQLDAGVAADVSGSSGNKHMNSGFTFSVKRLN